MDALLNNSLKNNKAINCDHIGFWSALGIDAFKVTATSVEAVACIFCSRCGLFRTKILTFRREFTEEEKREEKKE